MTSTHHSVLSKRVLTLAESETLKMARMARELRAQGYDVISLSLGEPDFDTPHHIKEAAYQALQEGYTKYTPVPGLPELTKAISEKFKRDNHLDYKPEQIVVSNGAKQSIYNICQALLDPGDEVVIFAPYWVSYWEIVKLSGGTPVPVYAGVEREFKPAPEQLEAAITPRTKFVLFSSPCNPTGTVFDRHELQAYAEVLARHDHVYVVSDEIYEYINFTHEHVSIGAFPQVRDRTITVNGFAKGFAMTGWRLGYMGAPKFIADACSKIQGQVTSGAAAFSQKAGAVALLGDLSPTYAMREAFRHRRDIVLSMLEEIPGIRSNHPEGAFYVFPDISDFFGKTDDHIVIQNADDFCDFIMNNAYVGLVSGTAFGDPNCFRLSYAASEAQLREAIQRMKTVLQRLH
ncbi:MAG: pyridoxal phosphate-dependent aminotransferase [Saprospiraceae bacterium]|nr:pyridoxal phosphate-dependent aminotransferase [Saprospiraceae bacterium]MDW8229499.1 pyridoxal phosphate-dependent aminotransferase [Saprospiraceae bacterium]